MQEKGALPYEGYIIDTKIAIQAIMPEVVMIVTHRAVAGRNEGDGSIERKWDTQIQVGCR